MKIGLPDTLRYHRYGAWWETFLSGIGLEVIKPIMALENALIEGTTLMPNEAPIVQLFTGRVLELAANVDVLLFPDLNPGAEPDDKAVNADPWALDFAAVLAQRMSLPPIVVVPTHLDMDATPVVAVRLGQQLVQNAQFIRRTLDRTQSALKTPRVTEPNWARASKKTVGIIGDPTLLEQAFLYEGLLQKLDQHGLHPVFASELPRERTLELGRARRPGLVLETDLEVVGGSVFLESKAQVRGLIALVQARAQTQLTLVSEITRRAHKPAILLELDSDIDSVLSAFSEKI